MAWNVFKKKEEEDAKATKAASSKKVAAVNKVAKNDTTALVPVATSVSASAQPRKKFAVSDRIFVRPLITEKSLEVAQKNVYVFEVALRATKLSVKKAFYNLYGVMPLDVCTSIHLGKVVRFGRVQGKRKDWKKASITVPKGTAVDIQ